ncbi:MAG: tRNA (guanosine(46)-N7)-methyltransferase TrmB [Sedimentisphaerales bacterium]|nr:tRNA (guanosine(46)-N7)-methyltransferase TrmB [Sedimentisphaerales bacterium]
MTKKQLKDYPNIALKPENINDKIDFSDIFGRNAAVHIEIGSGKGTFLVSQAQAFEEINFLGIEWASKYYKYSVDRIGRHELTNVRIIRTDAISFIADFLADASVECFHIYYPDPWPKKRHHKRRFICEKNITQLIRCLQMDGLINFATDHIEYFQWAQQAFEGFSKELIPAEFVIPVGAVDGELVGTNYERKYVKEDREVHTLAFRKK